MNEDEYFRQFSGYADYDDPPDVVIYEQAGWKVVLREDSPDQWSEPDNHYFVLDPSGKTTSPPINLSGYAIQWVKNELHDIEVAKWKAAYDVQQSESDGQ